MAIFTRLILPRRDLSAALPSVIFSIPCDKSRDAFTDIATVLETDHRLRDRVASGGAGPELAKEVAKAEEAVDGPPGLPPVPYWARARRGAFGPGGLWLGGGTGGAGGGNVVTGPEGDD